MLDTAVTWYQLAEVPLTDLFGMHGIYVLWDARGEERPSHIGSGNLITRLPRHFRRENAKCHLCPDGYVGIVGHERSEKVRIYTEAIKHLLFDVAADVGRSPRSKSSYSSPEALLELLRENGSYTVSFHRHDPLTPPRPVVLLEDARTIVAWTLDREDYWVEHCKMIPASFYRSQSPIRS